MKWKSKPDLWYPNNSGKRMRTFFAWLPVSVGRGSDGYERRWLERVTIEEEYFSQVGWEIKRFIDTELTPGDSKD